MDHHQAQPVEQGDHRKQQRIRVRGEAPDRQVRNTEQRQIGGGVAGQIQREALLLVGLHDEQRHRGDDGGEAQQEQLGVATVGQRRGDGHRRLRCGVTRLRLASVGFAGQGHAAARQSVPGFDGGGGSAVTVGAGVVGVGAGALGAGAAAGLVPGRRRGGRRVTGAAGGVVVGEGESVPDGAGAGRPDVAGPGGRCRGGGVARATAWRMSSALRAPGRTDGRSELRASSRSWLIASSSDPAGRPAAT